MSDQIYIGAFAKGLKLNPLPFNIDNDAFAMLYNAYIWRKRAKRKRGTVFLGRLQRQISIVASPDFTLTPWVFTAFTLTTSGADGIANLITRNWITNLSSTYNIETTSVIAPGSISFVVNGQTYTEPTTPDGTLVGSGGGSGTINYATGDIKIVNQAAQTLTGSFSYYPSLPVMGLEDFTSSASTQNYPILLAFDTRYSYQVNQSGSVVNFYDVNYYKDSQVPFVWNGQDYQQFWSTNYPDTSANYTGSLWATNNVPGLNLVTGTYVSGSGTVNIIFDFKYPSFSSVTPNAAFPNLVIGDVLWFNQWPAGSTINGNTSIDTNGTVTAIISPGRYRVNFTTSKTASGAGIAQILTNTIPGQDGIKWYDGDPTSTTGIPTATGLGWVNFAPPLTALNTAIDNAPSALYYLVGALAVLPFKDRLLFFAPWIQTSSGNPIQLQDTVIWSWNGTPYYNSLTPFGQTFDVRAYYVDQTGFGGFLPAGISAPIKTVSSNEDVLLIGFGGDGRKTRFVYTSNDIQPFLFYSINSELPSESTFSSITLDKGAIDIGSYGIALTDQQSSQRIDLDIPDSVFQIQTLNNGIDRVNAIRDYFKEWIYFSYPLSGSISPFGSNNGRWKFPTQTFLFNYRDNTWAILYENFTKHGNYRATSKKTWKTTGFKSWNAWREPWNSGSGSVQYSNIVAGNPQGFVLIKGIGTGEGASGSIKAIGNFGGLTQITSVNHCVSENDFLLFNGALGLLTSTITGITLGTTTIINTVNTFSAGQTVTLSGIVGSTEFNGNTYTIIVASGTSLTLSVNSSNFTPYVSSGSVTSALNGIIAKVISTADADNFVVDIVSPVFGVPGYLGMGTYARMSQPLIQTKQFPFYWEQGKKTRLNVQKYLMDTTQNGQVTVNIYLSQDPDDEWNDPAINVPPNSLVYSQLMYTCPESTNLGLTPANTNLQMPTAASQYQIWHRFNTSLIGDSIQIGITLSDAQMRNLSFSQDEITLHGVHLTVNPSSDLA